MVAVAAGVPLECCHLLDGVSGLLFQLCSSAVAVVLCEQAERCIYATAWRVAGSSRALLVQAGLITKQLSQRLKQTIAKRDVEGSGARCGPSVLSRHAHGTLDESCARNLVGTVLAHKIGLAAFGSSDGDPCLRGALGLSGLHLSSRGRRSWILAMRDVWRH